jgi:hypothetical protein
MCVSVCVCVSVYVCRLSFLNFISWHHCTFSGYTLDCSLLQSVKVLRNQQTSVFVSVTMPAYRRNRLFSIFFIIFLIIGKYIFKPTGFPSLSITPLLIFLTSLPALHIYYFTKFSLLTIIFIALSIFC